MDMGSPSHSGQRRPRRSGANSLIGRLQALCAEWPELQRAFRKGATARQLAGFAARFGRKIPALLLKFYSCFNGSRSPVWSFYTLLSLDEIARAKAELDGMEKDEFFSDWQPGTWWNVSWLPFLEENGNHLCLDLSAKSSPPVVEFNTHQERRNVIAPSFEAWLEMLVVTLENAPRTSEDDRIEFFESRRAASLRRLSCPDYPVRQFARRARAGKAKRV